MKFVPTLKFYKPIPVEVMKGVRKTDSQAVLSITVVIVAIFALSISKKVFKFPSCYWPYRIYVVVVAVLWAISQIVTVRR